MAKLAILAAVFGALLVATTARTTMLTLEVDQELENQRRGGSCRDQLQRAQMLSRCQDFLSDVSSGGGGQCGYGGSRYGSRGVAGSREFDACCNQLNRMDDRCMCEGLEEIVREQLQEGFGGREIHQVAECARQLPQMCGFGRSCYQIRAPLSV